MADNFLGEIRIVGFNFAPVGWAFCSGQLLPISQNSALFSLLGTYYGGDGISDFALPNLQGCAPLNFGQGNGLSSYSVGQSGGESTVTLLPSQIPSHSHVVSGNSGNGDLNNPTGTTWAKPHLGKTPINIYSGTGRRRGGHEPDRLRPGRQQPAAQQFAAVSDAEFHHRDDGDIPAAKLKVKP